MCAQVLQVRACLSMRVNRVCVFLLVHVMTLGPRRPVRSWMLEIFSAMAMRGPSTTLKKNRCYFSAVVMPTEIMYAAKRPKKHNTDKLMFNRF